MNAIPLLGIQIHHSDGHQVLLPKSNQTHASECTTSRVNLIMSTVLPSHKGRVVRAQVAIPDVPLLDGEFLFEPSPGMLEDCGLTAWESVVTAREAKSSYLLTTTLGRLYASVLVKNWAR